nr:toprim domain-containing protein [Mycobacterium avium]
MRRLSDSQKKFLVEATSRYHASLPGSLGERYLATRGLTAPSIREDVAKFRLGYVEDPLSGHEMYRGMLAIPYLRWHPESGWTAVSIRFRRLDNEQPKYLSVAGDQPWLFNTTALINHSPYVAIAEGEIDAMTAQVCGIPTVGVPGVQTWQPYFTELFLGYREVFLLADGDDPGMQFANKVAGSLPNAKVIPMPAGEDVNSLVIKRGKQELLSKLK